MNYITEAPLVTITPKISETLKQKRTSKKLSLRKLEELSGISNAYISQLENGTKGLQRMRLDRLNNLEMALGVFLHNDLIGVDFPEDHELPKDFLKFYKDFLSRLGIHYQKTLSYLTPEESKVHGFELLEASGMAELGMRAFCIEEMMCIKRNLLKQKSNGEETA